MVAFIIFECAGDDFRCGSGSAVRKNDGWHVGELGLTAVGIGRVMSDAVSFLDENNIAINPERKEIFCGGDVATAVIAEVEDDFLTSCLGNSSAMIF